MSFFPDLILINRSSLRSEPILAASESAEPISSPRWPGLLRRLLLLAAIFVLEIVAASIWLDTATLGKISGLTGLVGDFGPPVLRSLLAAAAIFLTVGYLNRGSEFRQISVVLVKTPVKWTLLAGHFVLMAVFAGISFLLFGNKLSNLSADTVMLIWLTVGLAAIPLAAFAFMPPRLWLRLVRSTGGLWAYATAAGVLAWFVGSLNRSLWRISAALTFGLVKSLLSPFLSQVVADPSIKSIGSPSFHVEISPQCSGVEGAGLMLIFGILLALDFPQREPFSAGVAADSSRRDSLMAAERLAHHGVDPDRQRRRPGGRVGWIPFASRLDRF